MGELERTAGRVIVCGFHGLEAPSGVRSWVADGALAGVVLFARNIAGIAQAAALIESCRGRAEDDLPLLVCVDQEGGRVSRFGPPVLRLPPMRELASREDPHLTYRVATVLGRQLRAIGVNLDFAPVLDVDTNPHNPVIGDRAFGASPEIVMTHAFAFAEGLHAGGVLSCGKHFPGHGDTDVDSHLALPVLRHDRARLDQIELRPFRVANGRLPSLMTAHVVLEPIDPGVPATLSPRVIGRLLREELGFAEAVFSDDLEMKAITSQHSIEEAGVRAIEAGCDLLLVCSDLDAAARLRDALAREASRSPAFLERLTEARRNADALRSRTLALPDAVPFDEAFHAASVRALASRLWAEG